VFAFAAVRSVVVRVIDVRERCGLELGVFHVPTLTPAGCGLLLYNSYSLGTEQILYKADAATRLDRGAANMVWRVSSAYDSNMKIQSINAPSAPAPAGGYSQALEVIGAQRMLFVSGQIPESATGKIPTDFPAQARLAWRNVIAQLEAAGMAAGNLVKVTVFLSSREFALANREIRQEVIDARRLFQGYVHRP